MAKVLLTAFDSYDRWPENSSWLALADLLQWYDGAVELTTRRYPVALAEMSERLRKDMQENFDLAIHLGQAPGSTLLKLESIGLNIRSDGSMLINGAPAAYRSSLDLDGCSRALLSGGIPNEVSHHAGTYLCNATMYLSQHYASSFDLKTRSVFVHIPLAPSQVAKDGSNLASMSTPMAAAAIALMINHLAGIV